VTGLTAKDNDALPLEEIRAVLFRYFHAGEVIEDFSCRLTVATAA
jgi:hypothetical protein